MEKKFKATNIVSAAGVNAVPVPPISFPIHDDKGNVTTIKHLCIGCATNVFLKISELLERNVIQLVRVGPEPGGPGSGIVTPS